MRQASPVPHTNDACRLAQPLATLSALPSLTSVHRSPITDPCRCRPFLIHNSYFILSSPSAIFRAFMQSPGGASAGISMHCWNNTAGLLHEALTYASNEFDRAVTALVASDNLSVY